MSDLVERLRRVSKAYKATGSQEDIFDLAADRIEQLEGFIKELSAVENHEGWQGKYFKRARALAGEPDD